MKKWIITIAAGVALLALGLTNHYWLRPFLEFLKKYSTEIASLAGIVALLAAVVGVLAYLYKHWHSRETPDEQRDSKARTSIQQPHFTNSVAIADSPVQGSVIGGQAQVGDVVRGDKITHIHQASPAPAATPLHQLPPPPGDFTGREAELSELLSKVEAGGVAISGLQGMGGVGKTALALKLAERLTLR